MQTRHTFVPFICGVMKSLASEEIEARKGSRRPVTVLRNGEPILPDAPALTPTPEQSAMSAIDDRPVLAAIAAGAEGDEQLQFLIEEIYDQMRGAKLQELLEAMRKVSLPSTSGFRASSRDPKTKVTS